MLLLGGAGPLGQALLRNLNAFRKMQHFAVYDETGHEHAKNACSSSTCGENQQASGLNVTKLNHGTVLSRTDGLCPRVWKAFAIMHRATKLS